MNLMKNTLFLFAAFSFAFPVFSQTALEWNVVPDWLESSELGLPWFDRASSSNGLPVFTVTSRLKESANSCRASLKVLETAVLSAEETAALAGMDISSDFQVESALKNAGRDRYFTAVVTPFRKDAGTGQIERLISGQLSGSLSNTPQRSSRSWRRANSSVLAEGTWYKMATSADGIYRINASLLSELGVDVSSINPQQINIYGNGGEQLPYDNSEFRYDDLQANAIFISGEDDGSFDPQDFILFYGKGSDSWDYDQASGEISHHKHHFSDSAYYYIRIDDLAPKRITNKPQAEGTPDHQLNSFLDYRYTESDNVSLVKSGREFFGEVFDATTNFSFNFNFPNIRLDQPAEVAYRLASSSVNVASSFMIELPDGSEEPVALGSIGESVIASRATVATGTAAFSPTAENVNIGLTYNKGVPNAVGYLDYLRVAARRDLQHSGNQMHFRDTTGVASGALVEWQLSGASGVNEVWDVTDITNVQRLQTDEVDGDIVFRQVQNGVREYISFISGGYPTPRAVGPVSNQNIHDWSEVEMVIVSSPLLKSYADQLAEHRMEQGMNVQVVTPMEVYNEFSSGNPDVTAIKMMMKHLYDEAAGNPDLAPKYLLMFGDGSYAGNKSVNAINSYNVITYQSLNVTSPTDSYVSDDYFALLDDNESEAPNDLLDIGVGRIPASNATEAQDFLNKLFLYEGENTSSDGGSYCLGDAALSPFGAWRNKLVFVADDQDGNDGASEFYHMSHSDGFSDRIYNEYNDFNVSKIYLDAYQQESTPGGERYPDAVDAIRRQIENGALVVNYVGHGGEKGWAHERVLDIPTINGFTNVNRLPVFMTATCELSRYDDPDFNSAGEQLLMNPNGGAIAMLTTTRIVFSGSNQALAEQFYRIAFEDQDFEGTLRLGDIARITKNEGPNSENTRNFSLLGDPSMAMAYPEFEVYTTHINNQELTSFTDTIRSLEVVNVRGYVGDVNGGVLSDFDGFVYPTVYDKRNQVQVLNNDGGTEYDYEVFQSLIYKGKASVENGEFEFNFVVPRDINYSFGDGRISYYAVAGNRDGHGHTEAWTIGGSPSGSDVALNTVGPNVELYMNDSTFVFGGLTDDTPVLFARMFDENGINTVGNGIGHDLKATLDNQTADQIILNDFYEADLDTYQSGSIRYQLTGLAEGRHTLELKVWDVHNNSSEAYTEFVVAPSAEVALDHVLNYPNPFTTRTEFMFEHNQPCDFLDVKIEVFTVSGKLVKTLREVVQTDGFRADAIAWDGKDEFGDKIGRGVYVYRLHVRTPDGRTAEQLEKLVVLN